MSRLTPYVREQLRQAVRTGCAGVLAAYVAMAAGLSEPHWAAVSAVIVMQSHVGGTIGASWQRIFGTTLGAAIGIAVMALAGPSVPAFGAAVVVTVGACALFGLPEAYRIASATVAIVVLVHHAAPPWRAGLDRFLGVALGIFVSVGVSLALWPSRAGLLLREAAKNALEVQARITGVLLARVQGQTEAPPLPALLDEREKHLDRAEQLLTQTRFEVWRKAREETALILLVRQVHLLRKAVDALEVATRVPLAPEILLPVSAEVQALADGVARALHALAEGARAGRVAPWPPLAELRAALDRRQLAVREGGTWRAFPLEDVMRLFALLQALASLAKDADHARSGVEG